MGSLSWPVTRPQVEIGCHELPREVARAGGGQRFLVGPSWVIPLHKLLIHLLPEATMKVFSLSV